MNLLLDTRILLWWLADDSLLPDAAREAIASPDNVVSEVRPDDEVGDET